MKTTIQVEKSMRDKLKAVGRKGETYHAILDKLIEHYIKDHQII